MTMDPESRESDLLREIAELRRRVAELEGKLADQEITEEHYRVLYESNPTMFFTLDQEGRVRRVNHYGASVLGYEPAELIGRMVYDVFHPEAREAVREQLRQCLAEPGKVREWELCKLHSTGREIWVHEAARSVVDASGEPFILVVCSDISELKSMQRQLEQAQEQLERRVDEQTQELRRQNASLELSERRYRSLVQSQNELIVRWNPDGTRTFVNDAYCRYAGQSREELVGTSFFPSIVEEDRERVREKVRSLTPDHPMSLDVHRVLRADGTEGWNEWSDRAFFDPEGKLVEIQSVGRDVTDRVQASEALAASVERYRLLAENISDVIVTLDLELGITYASPSVQRLLGYEPEEFCQLSLEQILTEPSLERVVHSLTEETAIDGQAGVDPLRSRVLDLELRSREGKPVVCETKSSFLRDPNGGPVGVLAVLRDITEWKKTQNALRESEKLLHQRRRLEAIGKLAGGLAHDFNNLLTVVYGNLELLELGLDSSSRVELAEIRGAADRGATLIRQLLAFGRRQVMAPEPVDLNGLIRDSLEMLPRLLGEDVEVVLDLDPALVPLRADTAQLEQVLINLAVNARDAMPEGGRLTFATSRVSATEEAPHEGAPPCWVELRVSDTGVGIPAEDRDRVFEPFFTTKEAGEGSGLGLASVYGIVQQSGGTISLESEEGQGSIFTIRLPEIGPDETEAPSLREPSSPTPRGHETILVVEDDPGVRLLLRKALESHGYRVLEASRGEEALATARLRIDEIDLVVTDLVMPGMSGVTLAEELADLAPQIGVLLMTGHPPESVSRFGDLSSVRPLLKPFAPSELLDRVRKALESLAPPNGGTPGEP